MQLALNKNNCNNSPRAGATRPATEKIMKSTVIITKRGEGYISTAAGKFGGGHNGARAGLTAYDAAATAARLMIEYAVSNQEGGELMAPAEVLELVPEHLRKVEGK